MIRILPEKWCVRFLLPLKYNDGKDIEPSKFEMVRKELLDRFGAFTISPLSLEGGWIDPENNIKYFDRTKQFEITIDMGNETEQFLREYKEKLKERFKQHEIYMIISPVYKV